MDNRLQGHFDNAKSENNQTTSMKGFDSEFTDIVDYIKRITYRIWEGKQIGLCYDYYSEDCPVYTLAGVCAGYKVVTENTIKTLASFPDRTLHADNIIWGGDDNEGYHSSHLISTHMTNLGDSEYGPATGKKAVIHVIAHCIVKDNQIIEEWLVRDNYALCQQLGYDPIEVAKKNALSEQDSATRQWFESEIKRLKGSASKPRSPVVYEDSNPEGLVRSILQNVWNAKLFGDIFLAYAEDARLYTTRKRQLNGHTEILQFYIEILSTLSDLNFSIDYVCSNSPTSNTDVAVRWSLVGKHTHLGMFGPATNEDILIIGESHYQIVNGKIYQEWTVFDEVAVLTQVERARLKKNSCIEN
ncbi:ester cyclase [Francisella sp. SYW-9]|uniref:ester cyclase n=1 Tax=Francisella sp. SYW-9 TaxID=2610888 RepID=UPI00123D1B74|nr:ester cyclase [Francisella sp. SYW-9]